VGKQDSTGTSHASFLLLIGIAIVMILLAGWLSTVLAG